MSVNLLKLVANLIAKQSMLESVLEGIILADETLNDYVVKTSKIKEEGEIDARDSRFKGVCDSD